jgi:hypothetical protein
LLRKQHLKLPAPPPSFSGRGLNYRQPPHDDSRLRRFCCYHFDKSTN